VPVVAAPAEIDVTTAAQLRTVLLRSCARGHAAIVVDMTRTKFCDSAGLTVLVRAHKRAVAEGGELRLVIPAGGTVSRIFAITGLDLVFPLFSSLDDALAPRPAGVIPPLWPRPSAGRRLSRQPGLRAGGCELVAQGGLETSVAAGPSGPVITLTGETDLVSAPQLSALISGQLSGRTLELTVDASGLRFADTASIRALILAARTLNERGGRLVLLYPQRPVARILAILGVDEMFTIRGEAPGEPDSEASAG